jgi:hypothetical protein
VKEQFFLKTCVHAQAPYFFIDSQHAPPCWYHANAFHFSKFEQVAPKLHIETTFPHPHHQGSLQFQQTTFLSICQLVFSFHPKHAKKCDEELLKLHDDGGFGACEKTNNCVSCGYRANCHKVIGHHFAQMTLLVTRFNKRVYILILLCVFVG